MNYKKIFHKELINNLEYDEDIAFYNAWRYLVERILSPTKYYIISDRQSKKFRASYQFRGVTITHLLPSTKNEIIKDFDNEVIKTIRAIYLNYKKFVSLVWKEYHIDLKMLMSDFNNKHTYQFGLLNIKKGE